MSENGSPFRLRDPDEAGRAVEPRLHVYGPGAVCDTEARGHAAPRDLSPAELVVDATQGFSRCGPSTRRCAGAISSAPSVSSRSRRPPRLP
jgi:hypothetical protein